jgi:Family of unknown function (DUF5696)
VNSRLHIDISSASSRLKPFRVCCGLSRSARGGFPGGKTKKSSLASAYTRLAQRLLRHRGELVKGLSVLLVLATLHVLCVDAFAVQGALSGRVATITTTAPVYTWVAPLVQSQNSLGTLTVTGSNQGSTVPLLNPSIRGKEGTLVCSDARWDDSAKKMKITYAEAQTWVHVTVTLVANAAAFEAMVDADQPVITAVDMGPWAPALQAQPVAVPYYTGRIWYLPKLTAYVNLWWDWRTTHATELNGTLARYLERTDASSSLFHERLLLVLSPDVDAVLPSPGNAPSPYMQELSGRLVLDIWSQDFKQIEQGLTELGDYGISDCVGIIHVWQHAGYDNALPEHYPANEAMGGDAGLIAAVKAGRADGCLMALHENYVDYYPNYPKFDPSAIALASDGKRMLSWLNYTTGVQSYWTKPAWMIKNASTQSPTIHERYGTTAAYLDVNSGISPASNTDMDARAPGGGTMAALLEGDTGLWSYERKTHQGPVFGEGSNHWYYSGLLDGVEAQFGAGAMQENQGAGAPLFVDFDLKRIHPLEVNHGMGYYERWVSPGETISNTLSMDDYRMQEIAFGHAPFLGRVYWDDVAHAFVESNLVGPVARSYGVASVSSIAYQVNGAWASPSVAAQSASFSRVQITYENGLIVVANASREPLRWQNMVLPQYGWAAKARGLLAYTAMCGSTVCDYAETTTSVFANARDEADAESGRAYATPSVVAVSQGSGRSLAIVFAWQVHRSMNSNYKMFVHFVDQNKLKVDEGIAFQADMAPAQGTSQWVPGKAVSEGPVTVKIPAAVADGVYSIRMGLYDTRTGSRVPLGGVDDGDMRYIVGDLTVGGNGSNISFKTVLPGSDPRLSSPGTIVSFGTVQTDGMISIREDHGQWVLRPFPRSRGFTVLLEKSKFVMPASVSADGGSISLLKPVAEGAYWKLPLTGAKSYSWPVAN